MRLIDRYLFGQFLGPVWQATLILTALAVLAEALSALGLILGQHQSVWVFARVVFLAMPQLILLVLPVAVLVASLMTMNRLQRENEVAICFAAGMSRWRLIAPAMRLSGLITIIALVIALWLQPLCYRTMRDILDDARSDLVATLVRPGAFNHPAGGITVYAQSVDESGVIHNLFIDRRLPDGRDTTITAREGRLQRRQAAPMLTLRDGVNEELSPTGNLTFLSFDNYVLDLRPFMQMKPQVRYKLSDRYLHELMFPVTESAWERDNALSMLAEGHSRIAMSLYPMAFMLLALAAVMGGPFDRLGYGGRIAVAGVAAVVTRVAGLGVQTLAGANAWLNLAQYAVPILLAAVSAWLLFRARESWSPSPTNARPLPFRSAHSPTAGVS